MTVTILRLSHRLVRDKRMSTHLALTARAFGADEFFYSGEHDSSVEESVNKVCEDWGGDFHIKYLDNALKFIRSWKRNGKVIHLTMYGLELEERINELLSQKDENMLLVVGGSKVPGSIYELADYNVAIGHQPHSEVAALAVFLDNLTKGKGRKKKFENAHIEIIPTERGKQTKNLGEVITDA